MAVRTIIRGFISTSGSEMMVRAKEIVVGQL
jgi:hypothetical protein